MAEPSADASAFQKMMYQKQVQAGVRTAVMGAIWNTQIDWDSYYYVENDAVRVVVFDRDGHQIVVEIRTNY